MAGYNDTRQLIIDTLMGRPAGTEIQPEDHQAFALALNDYIRSVEMISSGSLQGRADSNTVPVQPDNARVSYIASVQPNQTVIFNNFIGQNGNAISVTGGSSSGYLVVLMWNGSYWSNENISTASVNIVQETGNDSDSVMSQRATTKGLNFIKEFISSFQRENLFLELLRIQPINFTDICNKDGYYESTTGTLLESSVYKCSEKIFLKSGIKLMFKTISGQTPSEILRVSRWDLEGNYTDKTDQITEFESDYDCYIAFSLTRTNNVCLTIDESILESRINANTSLGEKRKYIIFPHYYGVVNNLQEALEIVPEEDRVGSALLFFKSQSEQLFYLYYLTSADPRNWMNESLWQPIYLDWQLDSLLGTINTRMDILNTSLNSVGNSVDSIKRVFPPEVYYSSYNRDPSRYSYTKVENPLVLADVGDFVEIECRVNSPSIASKYKYMMSLINSVDSMTSNTRFGWYNRNEIWLRVYPSDPTVSAQFVKWTNLPENSGWKKIKLLVVEQGWELFIDDVSYGVREKQGNLTIKMICSFSSQIPSENFPMFAQKYDINRFYISTQNGTFDSMLALYGGSVNVDLIQKSQDSGSENNPICFVSYDPLIKRFKIYMRDKNNSSSYYMMSVKLHSSKNTENDPILYCHFWEIDEYSRKCSYNSSTNSMTEEEQIIAPGESEFVFMYSDPNGSKADFTCGVHGDERIDITPDSFVKFYIDGVLLTEEELNQGFTLRRCNGFQYIQRSSVHDTAVSVSKKTTIDATGVGVLSLSPDNTYVIDGQDTGLKAYASNSLLSSSELSEHSLSIEDGKWVISKFTQIKDEHPVIGTHIKKTTFYNQSYRTENTIIFNSNRTVKLWYHGICCLHKNSSKIGHNENYEDQVFTGSTENFLNDNGLRMFETYNPDTKMSARISSELVDGGGVIKDSDCTMFIWDRKNDSKYYRETPTFSPIANKRLVSVMTVQFGDTGYDNV